ncbi:TIM barrel protein [Tropicimonas sp. TH_r6]|uniref:TIM barrel protein n=1 Tax=Tropicimonas sp. TH_r6 TaxID=3082085 RepID=UPI0029549DE1|nr:TIM barrel protein [Tropicimonas sp. TH_r6]MDV7143565.1 TIM barrel protein [Tropicimonas sp. TH_r6]
MTGTFPLSAHIGYLFSEFALRDRVSAARAAGFGAVEHPDPFEIPAREMARILDGEGMRFAQLSSGIGGGGLKGLACLPGKETDFQEAFRRSVDYAERIGCPFVHPMAGIVPTGLSRGAAEATYRSNIEFAIRLCDQSPVTVLVEAISCAFAPGYLINDHAALISVLAPYQHDVRVLLDTFHAANNNDSIGLFLASAKLRPGHVHIADFPGRHEPGTGRLNFEHLLGLLAKVGYAGTIGFEYIPSGATTDHLSWMQEWSGRSRSDMAAQRG